MSNKRMTFPTVPGETPRERFINLVRHVFSVPKGEVAKQDKHPQLRRRRRTRSDPDGQ